MGVIRKEDIIAWQDGQKIICANCGEPTPEAEPLTKDHLEEDVILFCDGCGDRVI